MSKPRRMELHRKQRRKRALKELRMKYQAATSASDKKALLAKIGKISPTLTEEVFLKTV